MDKEFVPLYQTLAWMLFSGVLLFFARRRVVSMIEVLVERVRLGAEVQIGGLSLGTPPAGLLSGEVGASVTGGERGSAGDLGDLLERRAYPAELTDTLYLIHAAEVLTPRTTPGSGRYRVRVWVESFPEAELRDVESVTYRLYDDFPQRVLSTTARDKNFELWLNVYGEFTIVAYAKKKKGGAFLFRYLDLPGRPPD
jgi:hypothetical protein